MTRPRPSSLRVLAKSLHLLALGWMGSIVWLWSAQIQQNIRRFGAAPDDYAMRTLVAGLLPALLVELTAIGMDALMARVPGSSDSRREWWHAVWWTLLPVAALFGTVYVMIRQGR